MMRRVLLFGTLVALFSGLLSCGPRADAAVAGWGDWLMPTGTICVLTGAGPAATAAAEWNQTDASMVADTSCAAYPRNMTVLFVGRDDSAGFWCARTGTADGWTWQYVRGVWTWTPNAPQIEINYASVWRAQCRATSAQLAHLFAHELGHVLGLAHNCEASVMADCRAYAWRYAAPTAVDVDRVNRRY